MNIQAEVRLFFDRWYPSIAGRAIRLEAEGEMQAAAIYQNMARDLMNLNNSSKTLTNSWQPCHLPGYEQRLNLEGHLETRPIQEKAGTNA